MDYCVILPAAGASRRFRDCRSGKCGGEKKTFVILDGAPLWLRTASLFANRSDVKQLILVVSPEDREHFEQSHRKEIASLKIELVNGGKERVDSVRCALAHVRPEIEMIAVHDVARPCVTQEGISAVFEAAEKNGASVLAAPIYGTIKRAVKQDGEIHIVETVPRENLWEAQTPQAFRKEILLRAYANNGEDQPTDDSQLVELLGIDVTIIQSDRTNIKITTQSDLITAEAVLSLVRL